jgi:two-component system chemotaxis sensor kinase CheA
MDKLQAIFITEAAELIADLERALLEFEIDINNKTSVQEIFRVMHTLKGSASMFGFDTLSALTHDLETVYDAIRDGRASANMQVLEITLQSVDHLKNIMHDQHLQQAENHKRHHYLLATIKSLLTSSEDIAKPSAVEKHAIVCTYYIYCKPSNDIFKNGTNPLFLIEDLTALGNHLVLPHLDLTPDFINIKVDQSYTSFEVILSTSNAISDLKDVFIFVEDTCEIIIEKISDLDLLALPAFVSAINNKETIDKAPYGLAIVSTIAASFKSEASSELKPNVHHGKSDSTTIRVSSDKLDELMNLVSELVTSQARLSLLAEQHRIAELTNVSENMDKITRRLRDNAFNICLVPIETLVVRFQRLVRDLSKDLKKEIEFVAEGTETELDRSIIEKVTDPILHILRNCLDHGIESPEEREKNGKKRVGKIQLKAIHAGTSVIIQIKDDGRGVDLEKVRLKAISKGLITSDAVLSETEITDLLFAPGFSTAEKITDVSGRGVGMDIVKRNIESIHGDVSLQTVAGQGTTIIIKLPLTLSIMDGMLVQIGASKYILPLSTIEKCFELETKKISRYVSQKHVFDGALLPVFNLHEVFNEQESTLGITQVIKINYDEFPVGITVDHIIGEYQAVMKPLGDMYDEQDEFSGATILGDGSVALVIDTDKLIKQLSIKELAKKVTLN